MHLLRVWEHLQGVKSRTADSAFFSDYRPTVELCWGWGLELVIVFSDRPWIEGSLLLDKSENVLQISLYQ